MSARKIQIKIRDVVTNTGDTINININLDNQYTPIDQADIIERKFIATGVEESINPIIDYEVVKFIPNTSVGVLIPKIEYQLSLLSGGTYGETYGHLGFENDDLFYRRNNLKESFLRLSFYDTDKPSTANKLMELTIRPQFINPNTDLVDESLNFEVSDSLTNPSGFSEGYLIYYNKDDEELATGKTVYMRAEFNNAKTGKSHKLMTKSTACVDTAEVNENLYTEYILTHYLGNRYIYNINDSYDNVEEIGTNLIVKLYETKLV